MVRKASYFFVLDVFIASAILVLTLVIIFSSRTNAPPPESSFLMAEDFMDFMATTELRDTGHSMKYALVDKGAIKDSSINLHQTALLLKYYDDNPAEIPVGLNHDDVDPFDFIEELVQGIIPEIHSIEYKIDGTQVYLRGDSNELETAFLVLSARRVSYIRMDQTQVLGPVVSEVRVWS